MSLLGLFGKGQLSRAEREAAMLARRQRAQTHRPWPGRY